MICFTNKGRHTNFVETSPLEEDQIKLVIDSNNPFVLDILSLKTIFTSSDNLVLQEWLRTEKRKEEERKRLETFSKDANSEQYYYGLLATRYGFPHNQLVKLKDFSREDYAIILQNIVFTKECVDKVIELRKSMRQIQHLYATSNEPTDSVKNNYRSREISALLSHDIPTAEIKAKEEVNKIYENTGLLHLSWEEFRKK